MYTCTGELCGVQDEGQVWRRHPGGLSSEEVNTDKSITAMYFNDDMLREVRGNNGPHFENREHKNIKC